MTAPQKLLYIGAGEYHFEVTRHFSSTKEFVFIDTQPRSCFESSELVFNEEMYYASFIPRLTESAANHGFTLERTEELDNNYFTKIFSWIQRIKYFGRIKQTFPHVCPALLTFFNSFTGQKIKYYISTNILYNMCPELEKDIASSEGLIISGFHPHKVLLQHLSAPVPLYCYDSTIYKEDEKYVDDFDNVVYWMFQNLDQVSNYFSSLYLVGTETGDLCRYSTIEALDAESEKRRRVVWESSYCLSLESSFV